MERLVTQKMTERPKSSAKWLDEPVCGCLAFRSQTGDNFLKTGKESAADSHTGSEINIRKERKNHRLCTIRRTEARTDCSKQHLLMTRNYGTLRIINKMCINHSFNIIQFLYIFHASQHSHRQQAHHSGPFFIILLHSFSKRHCNFILIDHSIHSFINSRIIKAGAP